MDAWLLKVVAEDNNNVNKLQVIVQAK